MEDIDKIIRGWERCLECAKEPFGTSQAYVDCEYTIGLYCGKDKLIWATIRALKEQKQEITRLGMALNQTTAVNELLRNREDKKE